MSQTRNKNYIPALILIGCLFFIFGFITWANSQLIPYLKLACQLSDTESYYVATAFFAAYFFMGLPSGYVLRLTGFKKGMSLGLMVMAMGALLFVPAANTRNFPLFLAGLFIIGTGLALLQTASNPYATILGPIESAAQRISIMGICNKVAGIIAVRVLGSITLKDADAIKARLIQLSDTDKAAELDALAQRVVLPYIVIAASLALLAVLLYLIHLPEVIEEENGNEEQKSPTAQLARVDHTAGKTSILQFPHLLMGVLAIFFYVGVEVISYDTFARFGEVLGYPLSTARNFAEYTGYGLLAGYIFSIVAIPRFISQQRALSILTVLSMILILVAVNTGGAVAVAAFAMLGFSNSVVWPAIWPLAINHLGKFTKTGSALLIMGIAGGAVLPPIYAGVARCIGDPQKAYLIMIPCYLYILYFAWSGHKLGLRQDQNPRS